MSIETHDPSLEGVWRREKREERDESMDGEASEGRKGKACARERERERHEHQSAAASRGQS